MAGEKVLVTGGAGFIGSHLVDGLLAKNYKVKVLDNFTTGKKGNLSSVLSDIELITGDIRDEEAIKKAVLGVDFVLHQAALGSVPRSIDDPLTTHECNSTGTLKLLLAARDAGVQRLVYASSSSVYGNTPTLPKIETMPPSPRSPYALSKLSGEIYCQLFSSLYGFETVSLRYFNVFGPRQDEHSQYAAVIPKFVTALLKGESITIFGDGSQTRDFTFIENVVAANLLAMTAPKETAATALNIACSGYYSILSVGEKLANILNTSLKVNFAESRPGDVKDSYADISKAKELIKYIPKVDFQTGLKQTAEWFQAQYLELVK
ncbi:MAG: SDR family oxidoreductase [Blastocatellia bacterium]|nr:SDR family oxidoreductase [Blastocatellia bacterium]MBN8723592.1 SDR family oxidoreductase [Acidobacteriota bacterium]